MLLVDAVQLVLVPLFQTFKNVKEQMVEHVQYFKVVLPDLHFEIKACELAQVTVRETVLGSKNWSNLENASKVRCYCHLLFS